ncbi:hypothetical protein TNCV_2259261 [Trichonephila clavipes]|nr:hypothetical protein TNCV_2259261 [Trichonephila clavipes]
MSSDESPFQLCPDDHRRRAERRPEQRVNSAFTIVPQSGAMVVRALSFDGFKSLAGFRGNIQHSGKTISSEYYKAILDQLNEKIKEKRPQRQKKKSSISSRKCSMPQDQEKDGQIERIGLRITFSPNIQSKFGPLCPLVVSRPTKNAPKAVW